MLYMNLPAGPGHDRTGPGVRARSTWPTSRRWRTSTSGTARASTGRRTISWSSSATPTPTTRPRPSPWAAPRRTLPAEFQRDSKGLDVERAARPRRLGRRRSASSTVSRSGQDRAGRQDLAGALLRHARRRPQQRGRQQHRRRAVRGDRAVAARSWTATSRVVGRVLQGMELLSALPRGPEPMGFYADAAQRTPILVDPAAPAMCRRRNGRSCRCCAPSRRRSPTWSRRAATAWTISTSARPGTSTCATWRCRCGNGHALAFDCCARGRVEPPVGRLHADRPRPTASATRPRCPGSTRRRPPSPRSPASPRNNQANSAPNIGTR